MAKVYNNLSAGMHSDNNQSGQPANTFRDGLNGNLSSLGNNKFSFDSVKGNTVSFSLPTVGGTNPKPFTPVGMISAPDRLLVLAANDTGGIGLEQYPGMIGEVVFNNSGIGTFQMLYYHKDLLFSKQHPFPKNGLMVKPENAAIKRLYFTDNDQPFRKLNYVDSRIKNVDGTIKHVANGDLVVGKQYMVIMAAGSASTSIIHNGNTYGPGHTLSNVFTAVNVNYTPSGAYVIEYIPIESLSVQPAILMGEITPVRFDTGGNLISGSNQYFYQLGTSDGTYTNLSYVTREIFIAGPNFPGSNGQEYQSYQGGVSPAVTSNKYLTLKISGIDQNFTKIRVGFIHSSVLGEYDLPKLFYSGEITGEEMEIQHFGSETTINLSNDDLVTPLALLDLVKAISATKNIAFAANIGLARDPNYDMSASVECETFAYTIPGDTAGDVDSGDTIAGGYAPIGHPKVGGLATGNTFALPGQWYEVISGSVIHNGATYNTGEFFQTALGNQVIDQATGPGIAVAVIRIQKYTSSSSLTAGNRKNIRILDDYCDYKGMQVSHNLMGYWRNEKYRFGMLLWHKNGFPLYVRFLCDKTFPAHWNVSADVDAETGNAYGYNASLIDSTLYDSTDRTTALRILGARFHNIDFQLVASELSDMLGTTVTLADLPDHIKGFSIVRCPIDAQIVGQGLLYPTVYTATNVFQVSTNVLNQDFYGALAQRKQYLYNWFSPEALFEFDGNPSVSSGDKLIIQDYYTNTDGTTGGLGISTTYNAFYFKHYVREDSAPMAYTGSTTTLYQKGSEALIVPAGTLAVATAALNVAIPALSDLFQQTVETNGAGTQSGVGSKTMLIYAIGGDEATYTNGFGNHTAAGKHKALVNWVRPKSNLYGGTSESAKANNQYIFTGHFQPFDDDFMTYMTGTTDGGGVKVAGIVNNVEVFGGDCFVTCYDAVRSMRNLANIEADSVAFATVFPVESRVNPTLRNGRHFAKERFYNASTELEGIVYGSTPYAPKAESFTYLTGYSNVQSQMYYPHKPVGFVSQQRDENIIIHSLVKTDGELIDNFSRFLLNNIQRTDSQFGYINNIMAKADKLFYLQFKGVGYMPVNERVTVATVLGGATQLGVGGVIDRQDEIDFFYGNQHMDSLMEADGFFGWFDFRRKTMMRMSFGGAIDKNGLIQGLSSYLQTLFDNIESEASPTIFNSDNPHTGKGITSIYDPRVKTAFMTFKFSDTNGLRTVEQDVTIGFNATLDKYIGKFSFTPGIYVEHNGFLLACKVVRPSIANVSTYVVGDMVFDATPGINKNYVCILGFTTGVAVAPNLDATHWAVASEINQIFVNWRGDICKFFGVVYPYYVDIVIKSDDESEITVDNVHVNGNNTRFTEIYCNNDLQSAIDADIPTYHKEYEYFDGKWHFTIPLSSSGERLSSTWMQLKMTVKNYTGNAVTTSNNLIKKIFSITSEIRKRL